MHTRLIFKLSSFVAVILFAYPLGLPAQPTAVTIGKGNIVSKRVALTAPRGKATAHEVRMKAIRLNRKK